MLDKVTQWWNEQSKANPRNSHTCRLLMHPNTKHTSASTGSDQGSTMCVPRAMSVVSLQFRQNAQCHLPPSLRSSSVSGRRAAGTVATWLDRTFPGVWPPPRPPSCNSNNAPQPRWCHWTPGHSPDYAICEQRWCPIQCVFMFHVSCQASFTMSAIGFG